MAEITPEQLKNIAIKLRELFYVIIENDGYLPSFEGEYMILRDDGKFVRAWFSTRKSVFTSLDGGDGYEAIAWRTLVRGE